MADTESWDAECRARERDRVALMLANPKYIDLYLDDTADYFFSQNYWRDKKLHALFCLLCELRAAGEPLGYISRLTQRGKELLKQREENAKEKTDWSGEWTT